MAGVWKRTLVYLGLAEDEEYDDASGLGEAPDRDETDRNVRTIQGGEAPRAGRHPAGQGAVVRSLPHAGASPRQVAVAEPRIYDDAQEFADRFRGGVPVIINMRFTEPKHSPKILHFASGLVYGLNGRMQKVAEQVYLITPFNVEVSADEKRRLAEHGFFNEF